MARCQSQKTRWKAQRPQMLRIMSRDGWACVYCGEVADTVDHVVPKSYRLNNRDDNLVASCKECNALAANYVFDSIEEKRAFVLRRRHERYNHTRTPAHISKPRAVCADCQKPFQPNTNGATHLLCRYCTPIAALEGGARIRAMVSLESHEGFLAKHGGQLRR